MDGKETKRLLQILQKLCAEKGEADATDLYRAAGIPPAEANAFFATAEEEGLADVVVIDLCCGEEIIIKGLTEKGLEQIGE